MSHPNIIPIRPTNKGPQLATLIADFLATKRAANLAKMTIRSYNATLQQFHQFLVDAAAPMGASDITRAHMQLYLEWDRMRGCKDSTCEIHFTHLAIFWKWVCEEEPQIVNPMARMHAPKVAETLTETISAADFATLLKAVSGPDYLDRRNRALLLLAYDSGIRVSGLAGLDVADIDVEHGEVTVRIAKGNKPYITRFGQATGVAIRRYLRSRSEHTLAADDALWLTSTGRLAVKSIQDMLDQIGRRAGFGANAFHMHQFRHSAAHNQLEANVAESDVMELFNWDDAKSLRRYTKLWRGKRARQHYVSPADKLEK